MNLVKWRNSMLICQNPLLASILLNTLVPDSKSVIYFGQRVGIPEDSCFEWLQVYPGPGHPIFLRSDQHSSTPGGRDVSFGDDSKWLHVCKFLHHLLWSGSGAFLCVWRAKVVASGLTFYLQISTEVTKLLILIWPRLIRDKIRLRMLRYRLQKVADYIQRWSLLCRNWKHGIRGGKIF